MGFQLIHGNDADALVEALAARLRAPRADGDLLQPEIVLVPQFGLRRWLEIRLAEINGILANVEFYAPAEYAWRLLRAVNPTLPEVSPYDPAILRWRIFAELPALGAHAGDGALHDALASGDLATRWRLAGTLAHIYERYLGYRADMLKKWERGGEPNDWQAQLWCRLVSGGVAHRARLLGEYLKKYTHASPPGLPSRLFAFACTNMSPDLLRFYGVVAQHCEFDFFMPNPCREYWGDVLGKRASLLAGESDLLGDGDNPLLIAYAKSGAAFVEQLYSYEAVQPQIEADVSQEIPRDNLLHRLQADVLDRATPQPMRQFGEKDTSIQFHIAHSRLREVQVLHDRLLDLFQHHKTLTPRDVAVMSPDIASYAPYIEAVFGGIPRDDTRHLPYTLSDCSAREAHPLVAFALRLAALPLSRFGLDEIAELLAEPAVLRKLDLDLAELERLIDVLREAGVRWGWDETQREAFGAGRYREFSWAFGLDRLLLGYASGDETLLGGVAPVNAIEGSDAQALGRVLGALSALQTLRTAQARTHTPAQWQKIYNDAFDALLDIDFEDRTAQRALDEVRGALAALVDDTAAAGVDARLDWQSVRDFLVEKLGEPERAYRFFGAGISISGMLPLRVVPFRVICLIGMNDGMFPRAQRVDALDRMTREPRKGDRSDRDDDRYLFLQLLGAAHDVFYLSWLGEDQRSGLKREPSAVVAELLDIVCTRYTNDAKAARKALVVQHPLQPFSPRYFSGDDARVFTYRDEWRKAATATGRTKAVSPFVDAPLTPAPLTTRELDDLRRFWRNPAQVFFNDIAGFLLPRLPGADEDDDPLALDGLGRYALIESMVNVYTDDGNDTDGVVDLAAWRARGLVPLGHAGDVAWAESLAPARSLAQAVHEAENAAPLAPPETFALDFGGITLSGSVPAHRDGAIVRWSAGQLGGKRLLDAWLDFLVLGTLRDDARLVLIGREDKKPRTITFSGFSPAQARAQLQVLLDLYARGRAAPLPFFPKASFAYAEVWRDEQAKGISPKDANIAALEKARNAFESVSFGSDAKPEVDDAAFALAVRGIEPFDPAHPASHEFAEIAQAVFAPLLATLRETP